MEQNVFPAPKTDWSVLMHALGANFARRSDQYDTTDTFVAENFADLKKQGVLAAGVPAALGGGGASYPELCEMLRILARYCGSTAVTLSMHPTLWPQSSGDGTATQDLSSAFCGVLLMSEFSS